MIKNCVEVKIEPNHFPKRGRYCNAMVEDTQNEKIYFYDCHGSYIWWWKGSGDTPPAPEPITITLPVSDPAASDYFAWTATSQVSAIRFLARRDGGIGATVNVKKNGVFMLETDLSLSVEEAWLEGSPLQDIIFSPGDILTFSITAISGDVDLIQFSMEFE